MSAAPVDGPRSAAEARAEVEARREETRAAREATFAAAYGSGVPGTWVIVTSWVLTASFALVALGAMIATGSVDAVFVVVCLASFAAGCLLFGVDLLLAAGRSREDSIGIGGLFFLAGSAPAVVRGHLLGSFTTQIVVALVAATVGFVRIDDRQLNVLAFGILVPMVGLAACGFWAVRWGVFPERDEVHQ